MTSRRPPGRAGSTKKVAPSGKRPMGLRLSAPTTTFPPTDQPPGARSGKTETSNGRLSPRIRKTDQLNDPFMTPSESRGQGDGTKSLSTKEYSVSKEVYYLKLGGGYASTLSFHDLRLTAIPIIQLCNLPLRPRSKPDFVSPTGGRVSILVDGLLVKDQIVPRNFVPCCSTLALACADQCPRASLKSGTWDINFAGIDNHRCGGVFPISRLTGS
jgi:hypothetical protein